MKTYRITINGRDFGGWKGNTEHEAYASMVAEDIFPDDESIPTFENCAFTELKPLTLGRRDERGAWFIEHTGGGCTAYMQRRGKFYVLITEDCNHPELGAPFSIGLYDEASEHSEDIGFEEHSSFDADAAEAAADRLFASVGL